MANHKIQLEVGMDNRPFIEGVDQAKAKLQELGSAGEKAGAAASKGIEKIDAAAQAIVKATERATKAQDLFNKELEKGPPSPKSYDAHIKAQEKLAAATKNYAEVQKSAFESVSRAVDSAEKKVDSGLRSMIQKIQRGNAELVKLQSGGLESAGNLYLAQQRGYADTPEFKKAYEEQLKLEQAFKRTSITAREMSFALRSLPAQFTDIAVSLQGGQHPMTVFLQQGGQLKDMFGGIGNAAKAMGGYIAGLVNPYSIAAVAVAGLAVAYEQGRKESEDFAKALILTGNAAGATTSTLTGMAQVIASSTGATKGLAAEALIGLAESGKVASDSMTRAAEAAVNMQRYAGVAIKETVKQFVELAKAPTEASAKINETANYLSATIYRQIKILEDQGRTADAAKLAIDTYANALNDRSREIEKHLGLFEMGWKAVAGAAKGAWDAMLDIGRPDSMADIQKQIEGIQAKLKMTDNTGETLYRSYLTNQLLDKTLILDRLKAEEAVAKAKEKQNDQSKASISLQQEAAKYLDKQLQKQQEIARVKGIYEQSAKGSKELADLNTALAGIEKKYKDVDGAKYIKQDFSNQLSAIKEGLAAQEAELKTFREQDLLSEREYAARLAQLKTESAQAQEKILAAQYGASTDPAERLRIVGEMSKVASGVGKAFQELELHLAKVANAGDEAFKKIYSDFGKNLLDPIAQANAEFDARYNKLIKTIVDAGRIDEALPMLNQLWDQLGDEKKFEHARKLYEELFAEMQAGIEAVRLASRENGGLLNDLGNDAEVKRVIDQYKQRLAELRAEMEKFADADPVRLKGIANAGAAMNKVISDSNRNWQKFADDIERSLTDSLMRSFEKGESFGSTFIKSLQNTLKTTVLKVAVQAIVSPIMSGMQSMLGMGSAAGAANSGLSLFGAANSGYGLLTGNVGGGLYGAFATSSIGSSLGLSTPFVDTLGGTLGAASGGTALTGLGTALPYLGAALAIGSALGLFEGDGPAERYSTYNRRLGKDIAVTNNPDGGPAYEWKNNRWFSADMAAAQDAYSAQMIAGETNLIRALDLTKDQIAAIDTAFAGLADRVYGFGVEGTDWLASMADEQILADRMQAIADTLKISVDDVMAAMNPLFAGLKTLGEAMGLTVKEISGLSDEFGGLENAIAGLQNYYQSFYSDSERISAIRDNLKDQFDDLKLVMPDTKDAFRDLVESLDLTTEKGQDTYAKLINLAPAFATVADAAAQAAETASQAAATTAQTAATAAMNARNAARQAAEANRDAAMLAAENALDAVRRSVDAEISALQGKRGPFAELVTLAESLGNSLKSAIDQLRTGSDTGLSIDAARGEIDAMLQAAWAGSLPDQDRLTKALAAVTRDDANRYASKEDWVRSQAVQAGKLETLNELVGRQKTLAELQLDGIDTQVKILEDQYNLAAQQLASLNGVNSNILGLNTALAQLAAAFNAALAAIAANRAAASVPIPQQPGYVPSPVTPPRYTAYASGGYAAPGWAMVGEEGPELVNFSNPARVYTAEDTMNLFGNRTDPELIAEIRQLRAEVRAGQGAIASNTRQTKDLLDSTINGANTLRTEAIAA